MINTFILKKNLKSSPAHDPLIGYCVGISERDWVFNSFWNLIVNYCVFQNLLLLQYLLLPIPAP